MGGNAHYQCDKALRLGEGPMSVVMDNTHLYRMKY